MEDSRWGGLRRELRLLETTALSVGVMAPTLAMSVTGGDAAGSVGRAAPLVFVVAALGIGLVAYGFVRLAAEFSHAGSVYAFVGRSLGPRAGFVAGWALLLTYLVFPPVSAMGVAVFVRAALRSSGSAPDADWYPLALVGLAAICWLAARGITPTARWLLALEGASLSLIAVLMVVISIHAGASSTPAPQRFSADVFWLPPGVGLSTLAFAAVAGFLAFAGFESAGALGEEALVPTRAIPRAIVTAVAFGSVFYLLCTIAQTIGFGTDANGVSAFQRAQAPLGDLATRYVGSGMAVALDLGAVLSAIGAGLGGVIVACRLLFAFGRDGLIWNGFAHTETRTGGPRTALSVETGVAFVLLTGYRLAGAAPLQVFFQLATIGVLSLLMMYALTNVAAAVHLARRAPYEILLPVAGTAVAGFVLFHNIYPQPAAPFSYFPYLVLSWLLLGLAITYARAGFTERVRSGLTRAGGREPAGRSEQALLPRA